jgi:hypothetical protein
MQVSKHYEVYKISADGLLKSPKISKGYGYFSSFEEYETEDDALKAIAENADVWDRFVVLPIVRCLP